MDGREEGELLTMYCPACGHGVTNQASHFVQEYRCPECNRLGYFRHEPLQMDHPADATTGAHSAHTPIITEEQAPMNMIGNNSTTGAGTPFNQKNWSGPGKMAVTFVLMAALGAGGYAAWRVGAEQGGTERAAAKEEVRSLQLEREYQDRLVKVLQSQDAATRLQGLQDLRTQLAGSNLAIEKTVTDQLLSTLNLANAQKDAAQKAKEAQDAYNLEELKLREKQLKEQASSSEQRQSELAKREEQAAKTLALLAAVESREKQVAEKEKQQQEVEKRLQAIENKLTAQSDQLNAQSAALMAQKEALDNAAALAQQQTQQQSQPIIIVKEPVPTSSTTYIVRESNPFPTHINSWSWFWGPRPTPNHPYPRPRPQPRPQPRPHH